MNRHSGGDYDAIIATPLPGDIRLGLRCAADAVLAIDFLSAATPCRAPRGAAARSAAQQLERYFSFPTTPFTLSLGPHGTAFQQRVWQALQSIPPGHVLTYGALARQLGSSARAVASACRANPVPLVVPCHRVVAAAGIGGFMGASQGAPIALKQWLLQHEAR